MVLIGLNLNCIDIFRFPLQKALVVAVKKDDEEGGGGR
jgi:hypothetical protein